MQGGRAGDSKQAPFNLLPVTLVGNSKLTNRQTDRQWNTNDVSLSVCLHQYVFHNLWWSYNHIRDREHGAGVQLQEGAGQYRGRHPNYLKRDKISTVSFINQKRGILSNPFRSTSLSKLDIWSLTYTSKRITLFKTAHFSKQSYWQSQWETESVLLLISIGVSSEDFASNTKNAQFFSDQRDFLSWNGTSHYTLIINNETWIYSALLLPVVQQ